MGTSLSNEPQKPSSKQCINLSYDKTNVDVTASKTTASSTAAGPALIAASWPSASAAVDSGALHQFAALKAVVRGIRNARAEYAVTPGRRIAATVVVPADPALRSPPPPPFFPVLFIPCGCSPNVFLALRKTQQPGSASRGIC